MNQSSDQKSSASALTTTYEKDSLKGEKHPYNFQDGQWHKVNDRHHAESLNVKQGYRAYFSDATEMPESLNQRDVKGPYKGQKDVDFDVKWVNIESAQDSRVE